MDCSRNWVIIAPNVILTAGHVIYDKGQGGYLSKVQIYQANTNGTKGATSIASVTGLIPNGDFGYQKITLLLITIRLGRMT